MKAALRALVVAVALILTANPAYAGFKASISGTAPTSGWQKAVYDAVRPCLGYEFDTGEHLRACVVGHSLPAGTQTTYSTGPTYWYELGPAGSCVGYSGNYGMNGYTIENPPGNLDFYGNVSYPTTVGQTVSVPVYAIAYYRLISRNQSYVYTNNACTAKYVTYDAGVYLAIIKTTGAGGNNPEGEITKECRVPPEWKPFFTMGSMPAKQTAGSGQDYVPLTKGTKFKWTINSGIEVVSYYLQNGDKMPETSPGMLVTYENPSYNDANTKAYCSFRRNRIYYDAKAGTRLEEMEVVSTSVAGSLASDIVVKAPSIRAVTTVSKPLIPNGTVPVNGKASKSSNWCEAEAKSAGTQKAQPSCRDQTAQMIAEMVEIEWSKATKGTAYVHPAPDKIARDNPQCVDKFDARCAWKQAETPVDEKTTKEELLRLSSQDGGQTVVNNYNYGDTIYPPAMVAAGTAPPNNTPPGSVDNPANPDQEGSGDSGGEGLNGDITSFTACYEDPGNQDCQDVKTGEAVKASMGKATDGLLPEPGDYASRLVKRAMQNGKCEEGKTSVYCSLAAMTAGVKSAGQSLNQDFVLFDIDQMGPDGQMFRRLITIPSSVMALLSLGLSIATAWLGFKILIGWDG